MLRSGDGVPTARSTPLDPPRHASGRLAPVLHAAPKSKSAHAARKAGTAARPTLRGKTCSSQRKIERHV